MEQDNISLQYGMYRTPSLGNDGELSECVNLIPKAGELVNIQTPETVKTTQVVDNVSTEVDVTLNSGETLLYIHETSRYKHYITTYNDTLYWFDHDSLTRISLSVNSEDVKKIVSIGNTIILLRESGLLYLLWEEGDYKNLGSRIPEVYMDFYLRGYGEYYSLGRGGSNPAFVSIFSKDVTSGGGRGVVDFNEELSTEIMGAINNFEATAKKKGFFCRPFYVMYGVRLYDESITNISSPILMTPSSGTSPFSFYGYDDTYGKGYSSFFRARLVYELTLDSAFSRYSDLIKSVCIFVTPQFQTYNESSIIVRGGSSIPTGATAYDLTSIKERVVTGSSGSGHNIVYTYSESFINGLDVLSEWDSPSASYDYTDNYVELEKYSGSVLDSIKKEFNDPKSFFLIEEVPYSDLIARNNDGNFYNVPTLYEAWNRTSRGSITVDSETDKLLNIESLPSLENFVVDLDSAHRDRTANDIFVYNNRVSLAGVSWILPSERDDRQFFARSEDDALAKSFKIRVKLVYDDQTIIQEIASGRLSADHNFSYFFHPDLHAKEVLIYNETDDKSVTLTLTRSDARTGMYYSSGLDSDGYIVPCKAVNNGRGDSSFWPSSTQTSYPASPEYSLLLNSEEGNPFVFPSKASLSIGTGEFLALSAPTEALSQGQFGEFIYAFCTDGIWALTVNDEGAYAIAQPVSRDVCTNKDSITQIDNAVVFVTNQGLKLISGKSVLLLSEAIEGYNVSETSVDVSTSINNFIGRYVTDRTPLVITDTAQFVDQVQTAKIVYDYPHQLLHIFPEPSAQATSYKHYVYSLDTKQWSTQVLSSDMGQLITAVPGYPLSTMQFGNKLYQYQKLSNNTLRAGYALTRPLSLGDPLTRKSLYDLRVFGQRTLTDTIRRVAVYVSNDNVNWYQLKSLKAMSAKYYRFLVMTYQCDIDTVSGLALQYDYRYNHKMRSTEK